MRFYHQNLRFQNLHIASWSSCVVMELWLFTLNYSCIGQLHKTIKIGSCNFPSNSVPHSILKRGTWPIATKLITWAGLQNGFVGVVDAALTSWTLLVYLEVVYQGIVRSVSCVEITILCLSPVTWATEHLFEILLCLTPCAKNWYGSFSSSVYLRFWKTRVSHVTTYVKWWHRMRNGWRSVHFNVVSNVTLI